ncbi:MAG: circularly permuted type 2 ATP-grasp protein, partial [Steroidobacteraceae bacterium]
MRIAWDEYPATASYDELIAPGGTPRRGAGALIDFLSDLGPAELATRQKAADVAIRSMGITFTVYHEEGGSIDRAWPLDIIPRVIALDEWRPIEAGLQQRALALNLFIDDIYHAQRIVRDGVFPREYLANSVNYRSQCVG